ncbi:MAG: hypothetical protein ACOY9D_00080 [Pseudomonadota bacterium]
MAPPVAPANDVKLVVEWQLEQSSEVATCVGKFALLTGFIPTAKVWPLWHWMQLFTMPT